MCSTFVRPMRCHPCAIPTFAVRRVSNRIAVLTALPLAGLLIGGCSASPQDASQLEASENCSSLLSEARDLFQAGAPPDDRLNSILTSMSRDCSHEHAVFEDERIAAEEWLAAQDELQRPDPQPGGGLTWDQAIFHVGTVKRVCGPLASVRSSDDDVFLNIGRDYPDATRFTIVIWDVGGVEYIEPGATLCTEGVITTYQGVAQIELRTTADVELWR